MSLLFVTFQLQSCNLKYECIYLKLFQKHLHFTLAKTERGRAYCSPSWLTLATLIPSAELRQDRPVPRGDHSSCSHLQRSVGTFVAIPSAFGDQVFISGDLPLKSRCHVVGGVPGYSQLHQLSPLHLPAPVNENYFLTATSSYEPIIGQGKSKLNTSYLSEEYLTS